MRFFADWIYKIQEWFREVKQRQLLISEFNQSAKAIFLSGEAPTHLHAKTSKGDKNYRHQYSQYYSGFRIVALSGRQLSSEELKEIARVILDNNALVRNLVINGFDTLEIHGENDKTGGKWRLKDYILLPNKQS